MGTKVLGIDLAKVTLPEALAVMMYAWQDAQQTTTAPTPSRPGKPLLGPPELDPWFHRLLDWSRGHYASGAAGSVAPAGPFTTDEALISAGLDRGKLAEMRAARILDAIGYRQGQQRRSNNTSRVRVWRRPA